MKKFNLVYHYNPYTQMWGCIPRDNYHEYFNGTSTKCGLGPTAEAAYANYQNKATDGPNPRR